ncbi:MAG TPA: hypothetical protein PKU97_00235 [Kofleriaceae bacterium]|nr:hypothetical protein [Kofleriaceae bacterium]
MTVFKARLVQDSALSISGLDRDTTSHQPFTVVEGVPLLNGRGLKGAAVAMARRFFDPLPRSVSETLPGAARASGGERDAFVRSAWEVHNARLAAGTKLQLRPGVGILQKTGARASGVLYDREVVPAGAVWNLEFRVDWRLAANAGESPELVEGILLYVLQEHWREGRCWLGGGAARGLGWCHLDGLTTHRISRAGHEAWARQRDSLPPPSEIRPAQPTRAWHFHTVDLEIHAGEYKPDSSEPAWGVDMLAIGPHSQESETQRFVAEHWALPPWAAKPAPKEALDEVLVTNRSMAMEAKRPLLPGSSLRGPMRHAYSRAQVRAGTQIQDPHTASGSVSNDDAAGRLFGTVAQSSQVLIRDGHAKEDWRAARLHQHAEDEFSAGSYGASKRDAVRLLRATFPVRIVIEGGDPTEVTRQTEDLDSLIQLGELGHLPIGGHKTRGAGWCVWSATPWERLSIAANPGGLAASPAAPQAQASLAPASPAQASPASPARPALGVRWRLPSLSEPAPERSVVLRALSAPLTTQGPLTLGQAAVLAQQALGAELSWWCCEPSIDLSVATAPRTHGTAWPIDSSLRVDEAIFFTPTSSWRVARTRRGALSVLLQESSAATQLEGTLLDPVEVRAIPARLHNEVGRFGDRFKTSGGLCFREWSHHGEVVGYAVSPMSLEDAHVE